MEGEPAVELEALPFDFNFDHLLDDENLQASPIEIVGDFSDEIEFEGELGSSCGSNIELMMMNQQNNNIKENLITASTNFNRQLLELPEDNVASLMETPVQDIWDNGIGITSPWMMKTHHPHSMPFITPLSSEQLPNQQLNNEVLAMKNVFEPQFNHHSMPMVGPSMLPGSQQFPYQNNQVPVTPEVYQPPLGCQTMVPQQTSRFDQLDNDYNQQQMNPVQTRHNIFYQQTCNNFRPETNRPQGLPYQNGRGSDLIDTYQQNPFSYNSEAHQNFLGQKRRFEVGESSSLSSSKRFRDGLERKNQVDWNPDTQIISHFSKFSNSRAIKSRIYDPLFEGIGLPIDPHLRMFALRY